MQFPSATRTLCLVVLAGLSALGLGGPVRAQQGGIEVLAAETLFASGTRVSLSHIYKRKGTLFRGSTEVADPLGRSLDEHWLVTGIDYGLRADVTLSALVPLVSKSLNSGAGDVSAQGLGDVALVAKYRAYKRDWRRSTFNFATIGGVETPTGKTNATQGGVTLPPGLQPGLGSWNPFVGLSANLSLDRFRYDALALYKLNTEGAAGYEKGDFDTFAISAKYRFLFRKYPGPTAGARLGLIWRHEGQASQYGVPQVNSGSRELLLHLGLGWHPRPGIDVSLAADFPLNQTYEGEQLGLDYRTFLAVGVRF
jgi:hypothetical protein